MAQSSACDTRYPPQLHRLVGRNYTPRSAGNSVNRTRRAMARRTPGEPRAGNIWPAGQLSIQIRRFFLSHVRPFCPKIGS
jgi:hypothetical protein